MVLEVANRVQQELPERHEAGLGVHTHTLPCLRRETVKIGCHLRTDRVD